MAADSDSANYSVSEATVEFGAGVALALNLDAAAGALPRRDFAAAGALVATVDGEKHLGEWLIEGARDRGAGLARCTSVAMVGDVFSAGGGSVLYTTRRAVPRERIFRHEMNNRINAVKVNADLIRVIAQRQGLEQMEVAAERILEEVQATTDYVRAQRPPATDGYQLADLLPQLVWCDDGGEGGISASIEEPGRVPASVVLPIAALLNQVSVRLRQPFRCYYVALGADDNLRISLQAVSGVKDGTMVMEEVLRDRWRLLAGPPWNGPVVPFACEAVGAEMKLRFSANPF